jgi:hypothetical protein
MRVKPGDLARVIDGAIKSPHNLGAIVEVCSFQGNHSEYGPIWRCKSKRTLISEYGATGNFMDFADDWLEPIVDPQLNEDTIDQLERVA